jgi:hypothetical protein
MIHGIGYFSEVLLSPLDLDVLVALTCSAAGHNFSEAEWHQYFPDEDYRKTCER